MPVFKTCFQTFVFHQSQVVILGLPDAFLLTVIQA